MYNVTSIAFEDLPPIFPGLSQKQTEEKISNLVVDKYLRIVRDTHERLTACKTDPSILLKGFWQPDQYYRAAIAMDHDLTTLIEDGSFYHGLPPTGFEHVKKKSCLTGKKPGGYHIKENYLPSEAVKSIGESLCFIDCQEALEIAYYEVLLEIFGEEGFNQIFKGNLVLDTDVDDTPLEYFLAYTPLSSSQEMCKAQQIYYFNSDYYNFRHILGSAQGHYCLCIEEGPIPRVTTFGKSPDGYADDEMYKELADDFNLKPIPVNALVNNELASKLLDRYQTDKNLAKMEYANSKTVTVEELKMDPHNAHLTSDGQRLSTFKIQLAFLKLQAEPEFFGK